VQKFPFVRYENAFVGRWIDRPEGNHLLTPLSSFLLLRHGSSLCKTDAGCFWPMQSNDRLRTEWPFQLTENCDVRDPVISRRARGMLGNKNEAVRMESQTEFQPLHKVSDITDCLRISEIVKM
jgi:hypothetical protein